MDDNGEAVEVRQRLESFPIALMALPVKPQSTWTLEPEHAQNILGGQVIYTAAPAPRPTCMGARLLCSLKKVLEPEHVRSILYGQM